VNGVYIHVNGNESTVFTHLSQIVTDPGLSANLTTSSIPNPDGGPGISIVGDGRVSFSTPAPFVLDVGSMVLRELVNDTNLILLIRGEDTLFEYRPGDRLIACGGVTSPVTIVNGKKFIQIYYDVNGCKTTGAAMGYFVIDGSGNQIPMPFDVILLHELIHAWRKANGTRNPADPEGQIVTTGPSENDYRTLRSMPLRATSAADVHRGGPNCALPPAMPPAKVTPKKSGCIVATAAYGNELEPEVALLRRFRDDVLLPTRTGAEFFDRFNSYYYSFSPAIADAMRSNDDMAKTLKISLVEPITHFLDLILQAPDAPIEGVPEPWLSYLRFQLDKFDRWIEQVELPLDFSAMTPDAIATELATLLRYALRTPEKRDQYLAQLERLGALPLRVDGACAETVAARLRCAGRPESEIARIVRPAAGEMQDHGEHAFGVNEDVDIARDNPSEWFYTVTFRNSTHIAADPNDPVVPISLDFRVFYKRRNLAGIVYQEVLNVPPSGVAVIAMGVCSQMESYSWGAWGYVEDNGKLVYDRLVSSNDFGVGSLTPQKVSQLVARDTEPCADSWEVTS
jgi:hypothetical protein